MCSFFPILGTSAAVGPGEEVSHQSTNASKMSDGIPPGHIRRPVPVTTTTSGGATTSVMLSSSSSSAFEDDDALTLAQMTLTPKTALRSSSKVMLPSSAKILSDSEEGEDEDEDDDDDHSHHHQRHLGLRTMHLASSGLGFKGTGASK